MSSKTIYPGEHQESLRVGCAGTIPNSLFSLDFNIVEAGNLQLYSFFSILNIKVTYDQIEVKTEY